MPGIVHVLGDYVGRWFDAVSFSIQLSDFARSDVAWVWESPARTAADDSCTVYAVPLITRGREVARMKVGVPAPLGPNDDALRQTLTMLAPQVALLVVVSLLTRVVKVAAARGSVEAGQRREGLVLLRHGAGHHSSQASTAMPSVRIERLTPRESDVLAAIRTGLSTKEMSRQLGIGHATVDTHVNHLYRKLGVTSRSRAITAAADFGLA